MNKKRIITFVAIGLLVLLLILAAFLIFGKDWAITPAQTQNPTGGQTTAPTQGGSENPDTTAPATTAPTTPENTTPTTPNGQETIVKPDDTTDVPPQVVIPDTNPEEAGLQFPAEVPGHNMTIEKLADYSGLFVEDGSNRQVDNVAMLLVKNTGTAAVEYTEVVVKFAQETLVFHITALAPGAQVVVQEKDCKPMPTTEALEASALVVHRAQMVIAPEVSITDNGDNSLTIQNLTDKAIPTVRVFYKYYMQEEGVYVGGIAFTVRITNLDANSSVVVQPAHYISATSRVVMAQVYDSAN